MAKTAQYEGPWAETHRAVAGRQGIAIREVSAAPHAAVLEQTSITARVEPAALAAAADSTPATCAAELAAQAAADGIRLETCAGMAALAAAGEGSIPAARAGMDKMGRSCAPGDTPPATGNDDEGLLQASSKIWGLVGRV